MHILCFYFVGQICNIAIKHLCESNLSITNFYSLSVEYSKNQDPYLLYTGNYTHLGPSIIALSADANSLAIAHSNRLWVFNTNSGEEEESFEDVHTRKLHFLK